MNMLFALLLAGATVAWSADAPVANTTPVDLEGPRLGFSFLSSRFVDSMKEEHNKELNPLITQFGWQIEKRFFTMSDGATGISEWVLLVGGFEQGLFVPSVSWLMGMRSGTGLEFGMGPNLSASGSSIVLAMGVTLRSEEINFPLNIAVAASDKGPRYSLLFGFNLRESGPR